MRDNLSPMNPNESVLFVAGATGYTGREVVRLGRERGCRVVAHIRPDSPSRAEWEHRFSGFGAEVDTTDWELDAMAEALGRHGPSHVFALLGTTKSAARKEQSRTGKEVSYETVDYRLTMLLLEACSRLEGQHPEEGPRFIYLSAMGVGEAQPSNAYMRVRWRVEKALHRSAVPFTIVRPSFITGPNRDELRPGERIGATLADGALAVAGVLGGRRLQDRYRSMTNTELAGAMLDCALDPSAAGATIEADALRG